jgi:hypothetical protein
MSKQIQSQKPLIWSFSYFREFFRSIKAIRNWSFPILLILTFTLLLFYSFTLVQAKNVDSDSYHIQMGDLNMGAGLPTSAGYNLGITGGQTAPGAFLSSGYQLLAGFWYIKTIIPFSFTIDDLSIDFGALTPNQFSTESNNLTVSAGGAGGYQVTAQENKPLTLSSDVATIPDTTCDDTNCTEILCRPWTETNKYGFGFNMSGDDVDTGDTKFKDSTYFCQFADQSAGTPETPQVVMFKTGVTRDPPSNTSTALVTYQINISGNQGAGDYENYVMFIATPTY